MRLKCPVCTGPVYKMYDRTGGRFYSCTECTWTATKFTLDEYESDYQEPPAEPVPDDNRAAWMSFGSLVIVLLAIGGLLGWAASKLLRP